MSAMSRCGKVCTRAAAGHTVVRRCRSWRPGSAGFDGLGKLDSQFGRRVRWDCCFVDAWGVCRAQPVVMASGCDDVCATLTPRGDGVDCWLSAPHCAPSCLKEDGRPLQTLVLAHAKSTVSYLYLYPNVDGDAGKAAEFVCVKM